MAAALLVLLLEWDHVHEGHSAVVSDDSFRVVSVAADATDLEGLVERQPAVVAIELVPAHAARTLALAAAFRAHPRTRRIPFLIYGPHLRARDIESAARSGALWLRVEPADGTKLVAALRGLLAASSQ